MRQWSEGPHTRKATQERAHRVILRRETENRQEQNLYRNVGLEYNQRELREIPIWDLPNEN
jgi:hypothetical protein